MAGVSEEKGGSSIVRIQSIKLSRLEITGPLNMATPFCVIKEVADAHGLEIPNNALQDPVAILWFHQKLRETEALLPVIPILNNNNQYTINQYRLMVRFVNKEGRFSAPFETLRRAFHLLVGYMGPEPRIPSDDFKAGLQTASEPLNLNACILYRLCRRAGITTNIDTTLEQMATAYDYFSHPNRATTSIRGRLPHLSNLQLTNMIVSMGHQEVKSPFHDGSVSPNEGRHARVSMDDFNMENLIRTENQLQDPRQLAKRLRPLNAVEAVVLGAKYFRLNLRHATSPIDEYLHLMKADSLQSYIPLDERLRLWYQKEPNCLRIDGHFDLHLPQEFYGAQCLNRFLELENLLPLPPGETAYQSLQANALQETFHAGWRPNIENASTPVEMDDVKDLPSGALICYGVGDYTEGKVKAYKYSELAQSFRTNLNFSNPGADTLNPHRSILTLSFSLSQIAKLKRICQTAVANDRYTEEKASLLSAIALVEVGQSRGQSQAIAFYNLWNSQGDQTKRYVQETLNQLFETAMYMRSWAGPGSEYPIRNQRARLPQDEIDRNVSRSLGFFEQSCERLGSLGRAILDLPLVIYRDEFQVPTSNISEEGRTIGERIQIVKRGDGPNAPITSCIRLSSNWLAASAYRYMQLLGMREPFPISQLAHIS